MELNERKKKILKSVIDAYIASGEPVGSKYLTSYGNISLSPATIRNEMSELEEMGYLDKPHTSAGRVPSGNAYRLYVDELMESYRLTMEELNVINELVRYKTSELDKIISKASKIMSDMTHYVTLSFTKDTENDDTELITRFDAVPVDSSSFLLVMILSSGKVRSEHIKTDCFLTGDSTELLKTVLNENLAGLTPDKVTVPLIMKTERQAGRLAPLINPIIRVAFRCAEKDADGTVHIDGLSNLLDYPELSEPSRLRSLMDVFDKKAGELKNLLSEPQDEKSAVPGLVPLRAGDGMRVYIGDDEGSTALSDTSLVLCSFPVGGSEAVIGVLGPKRMDYRKVVSTLRRFTETIEENLDKPERTSETGEKNSAGGADDTNGTNETEGFHDNQG